MIFDWQSAIKSTWADTHCCLQRALGGETIDFIHIVMTSQRGTFSKPLSIIPPLPTMHCTSSISDLRLTERNQVYLSRHQLPPSGGARRRNHRFHIYCHGFSNLLFIIPPLPTVQCTSLISDLWLTERNQVYLSRHQLPPSGGARRRNHVAPVNNNCSVTETETSTESSNNNSG